MIKYHFDLTCIAIHDDKEISAMDGSFDTESNVQFNLDGLTPKIVRDRAHEMFDRLLDKILPKDESPKERIKKSDDVGDKEIIKKYFENVIRRHGDDVPAQVLSAYILTTFGNDSKKKDGECGCESPCDECCCAYQEA